MRLRKPTIQVFRHEVIRPRLSCREGTVTVGKSRLSVGDTKLVKNKRAKKRKES